MVSRDSQTSAYIVSCSLELGKEPICIDVVFDSGSPISLIRDDLVRNETWQKQKNENAFEGINKSKIILVGTIKKSVTINDCIVDITFHVVPMGTMHHKFFNQSRLDYCWLSSIYVIK